MLSVFNEWTVNEYKYVLLHILIGDNMRAIGPAHPALKSIPLPPYIHPSIVDWQVFQEARLSPAVASLGEGGPRGVAMGVACVSSSGIRATDGRNCRNYTTAPP